MIRRRRVNQPMPSFSHNEDLGELYEEFFPKVFSYVSYRVGSVHQTEEIVSIVFLRAAESYPRFRWQHDQSFSAWVFRITQNAISDFHRKGQAQRTSLSLDDLPEIASDETPIEQKLFMKERFKLLREVISSLAPRAQEVITLRFFGELSNQEIAEVLGVEQRTVSGYLTRGLRDLEARYLLRIVDQTREESHHGDR